MHVYQFITSLNISLKDANDTFTELTFVYEENERIHELKIELTEQVD